MLALGFCDKPGEITAALQRPCMESHALLGLLVCDKCICSGPAREGEDLTFYLSVLGFKKTKQKNPPSSPKPTNIVLEWESEFVAWESKRDAFSWL